MKSSNNTPLPIIIAGPILRQVTPSKIVLWLVCSQTVELKTHINWEQYEQTQHFEHNHQGYVRLGKQAHLHLLEIDLEQTLPFDTWINYDIVIQNQGLAQTLPHLLYDGETSPRFMLKSRMDHVLHGSCRKPHYVRSDKSENNGLVEDGLVTTDKLIQTARNNDQDLAQQPAILLMSGDQVYVDDVAAPMLSAIHQTIALLGLEDESLKGAIVKDSQALYQHTFTYYDRAQLLPDNDDNKDLQQRFFTGASKPIFTSANADNHLITLAEVIAMYILVWSPSLWSFLSLKVPDLLPDEHKQRYLDELIVIQHFQETLPQVQRVMSALPVYMIFDDHDITDDWNLTRAWEESAYNHPFSRRIIGNAMIAYFLFQGWGNAPEHFPEGLKQSVQLFFARPTDHKHRTLIDTLLGFDHWHYSIDTHPHIIVLDTRTKRWWSESRPNRPSGLIDWENLMQLQLELLDKKEVILVSPAPIFGVKFIEVVQSIFTYFGHALTVDAENWMAHPGSANTILNIFRHTRTPQNFIILSGDVHYSFVYDVALRHYKTNPNIWQITSSGVKNEFPHKLLRIFDRINRILFSANSPLNRFTRRRAMRIQQRRPAQHKERYKHQRFLNSSGIGRVWIDDKGAPYCIENIKSNGEVVKFTQGHEDDWVH